ncbi:MAG: L-tartrate/succinate antiporter [Syntrophaceae bacterium PtaU1.Bin231]|nr:MAG: L-tartrate/succinate antiporter [Syntrophaceae bacterium PtaU1.Bin231]
MNRFRKIAASLAAFAFFLLLPPFSGLAPAGQRVAGIVILAIFLWTTEALPVGVSSLVVLILLGVMGGLPHTELFTGFRSPILYFMVGVMIMGGAIVKSGLASRAARFFLHGARGSSKRLFFHCLISLPPLALILPSAITRNAFLLPAYQETFRELRLSREDGLLKSVVLTLGLLNPLASSAFMTGGLAPMTTATMLGGFTWWKWFFLMSVPYYALMVLGGLWIAAVYPFPVHRFPPKPTTAPSPLASQEIRVIAVFLLTSILWLTDFWHGLHPAIPALIAALLLCDRISGVLSWKEMEQAVPWSIFLVLGASFSLAQALIATGAAGWFADAFSRITLQFRAHPSAVAALVVAMTVVIHLGIANMSACIALLIPITTLLAQVLHMNPLVFGLIVGISVDAVILYPVQTATNLVAYETGLMDGRDVLKVGLGMWVLTTLVVVAIALPWWSFLGLSIRP